MIVMELSLSWVPREQNSEADALTNEEFRAFDPEKRVTIDLAAVEWCILPRMMDVARDIYRQAQAAKVQAGSPGTTAPAVPRGQKRRAGLRVRDPW